MDRSALQALHDQCCETQSLILDIIENLRPEQWTSRPDGQDSPIAFHVWHIAREADLLQSALRNALRHPADQIWDREHLASRWACPVEALGLLQSGIGMDAADVARIAWPGSDELTVYLRKAFDAVNEAIQAVGYPNTPILFQSQAHVLFNGATTVERALLRVIASSNRHLGVIGWISASILIPEQELYSCSTTTHHRIVTVPATRFISNN